MTQHYLNQSTNLQLLQAMCKVHGAKMSPARERRLQGELQILPEQLNQPKEASQDHTLKQDNLYRTCMQEEVAHPLQQRPMEFSKHQPCYQEWLQENHTMGRTLAELQTSKTWRLPWQVLAATSISQTCSLPRKGLDGNLTRDSN